MVRFAALEAFYNVALEVRPNILLYITDVFFHLTKVTQFRCIF